MVAACSHRIAEPALESANLAHTRELAMSAAWHGGFVRQVETLDGNVFAIRYRGTWSHGFGPDFADAILESPEGTSRTGAVEIHRRASDWLHHGHHRDPAYNSVILHVVARADIPETRTENGALVPMVVLDVSDADLFRIDQELPAIWDRLGHSTCAEHVALHSPIAIRNALNRLGDQRFASRVDRFEGDLTTQPLESLLIVSLAEALGYSQNREPMRAVATALIESGMIGTITGSLDQRCLQARALVFGIAGFLPFSPTEAHVAGVTSPEVAVIEEKWLEHRDLMTGWTIPATAWHRARTRPANHPVVRIDQFARLLAMTHGHPTGALLDATRSGTPLPPVLSSLSSTEQRPLGAPRATALVAAMVLPLLMAHAHHLDDDDLEDAVARQWNSLPRSEWSRPAKRALAQAAGDAAIGPIGERAIQGLLRLDRDLCAPRRCHECPIAEVVVRDRLRTRAALDTSVR